LPLGSCTDWGLRETFAVFKSDCYSTLLIHSSSDIDSAGGVSYDACP
jgi:hypothetical protein